MGKNSYKISDSKQENIGRTKSERFIYDCLSCFSKEVEYYSRENVDKTPWINIGERPLLGLLSTGIIRNHNENSKISILQEFGVRDEGTFIGRCDLFMKYYKTAYLIESKRSVDRGSKELRWNPIEELQELNKVHNQLIKYIENQKSQYGDFYSSIKLVSLVFNIVYQTKKEKFDKFRENAANWNPPKHHFYQMMIQGNGFAKGYYGEEIYTALEIYGRIDNYKW